MFHNILVPIDLSQRNAPTLRIALGLARAGRARVTLLHVIQRIDRVPPRELAPFYRRLHRASAARLEGAAAPFVRAGVQIRRHVLFGEPAREIIRVALRARVDLIVMGSHRVRPAGRGAAWGTTSYKVGIFCQCPILLVK
jgi:nucleotide-binding universal stress UspA family protein